MTEGSESEVDRGVTDIECTDCGTAPRLKSLDKNRGTQLMCDCDGPGKSLDAVPYELGVPELPDAWEVQGDDGVRRELVTDGGHNDIPLPPLKTDGGRDIDFDEPPKIPDPPMYPEWEGVETWLKANLRYPVPGGWEIADHGKFHTTWEHEDGTEVTRSSKRTPGQKDTFAFTVDGEEIHSVDSGPKRVKMREETVWLLQFYDENGIESVEEFEVEVRKERNQSLDSFAGGDSDV